MSIIYIYMYMYMYQHESKLYIIWLYNIINSILSVRYFIGCGFFIVWWAWWLTWCLSMEDPDPIIVPASFFVVT